MESMFDHLVRTVSLKYKQNFSFSAGLKDVIGYANFLLGRYCKVHIIDVRIRIEDHKYFLYKQSLEPGPMKAVLAGLNTSIPRELKIRLEFANQVYVPWNKMAYGSPEDFQEALEAAIQQWKKWNGEEEEFDKDEVLEEEDEEWDEGAEEEMKNGTKSKKRTKATKGHKRKTGGKWTRGNWFLKPVFD